MGSPEELRLEAFMHTSLLRKGALKKCYEYVETCLRLAVLQQISPWSQKTARKILTPRQVAYLICCGMLSYVQYDMDCIWEPLRYILF